jgi:hypothetical protein
MFDKRDTREVNTLSTDYLSVAIAAILVDDGFDADKVVVLRRSGAERQTDKEVVSVEYKPDYEGDGSDILLIKTNLRGIYDNLPEGIFHTPSSLKDRSKEKIIEGFRHQRRDEFYVRRFFSPYEAEVERRRLDIRLAELRYDRPTKHSDRVNTIGHFWPVIRQMDPLTATLFVSVIPHIEEIRGRYAKIARMMTMLLGYPVRIERENRRMLPNAKFSRLGTMRSRIDSVLKGTQGLYFVRMIIEPPKKAIDSLVPSGTVRGVVETLLNTGLLPGWVEYEVVLKPEEEACTNRFGGRLGIDMKLKNTDRI